MLWSLENALPWRFSIVLRYILRKLSTITVVACLAACGAIPFAVAADPPPAADLNLLKRGKLLFVQCIACHDIAAVQPSSGSEDILGKIGPNLHGLMGRPAGALAPYPYSDALRNSGLKWDKPTLDRWIKQPGAVVPGTVMAYIGMPNEADRRALIAYLETATR